MYIFSARALASCRCRPLSSNVGPRMPTLTGTSPFFETQERAPRGTSAFATFREQFRQLFGIQNLSLTLRRATLSNVFCWVSLAAAARRSRATQAAQWRPCSAAFGYFSLGRAVASQRCAVQGPTPRSSGAPTAAHQARSVVPDGAFSTARAWRATVVSRLACTLGLTEPHFVVHVDNNSRYGHTHCREGYPTGSRAHLLL